MVDNMARKCIVCNGYILDKEKYKKLELVQGPVKEETAYVHLDCYKPDLLSERMIKVNSGPEV